KGAHTSNKSLLLGFPRDGWRACDCLLRLGWAFLLRLRPGGALGPHRIWAPTSPPGIHEDLCLLNFGPGETTYLLAVDKKTGKTVWKQDEATAYKHPKEGETANQSKTYVGSWTTPVLMEV